jgi:hypothetical protein
VPKPPHTKAANPGKTFGVVSSVTSAGGNVTFNLQGGKTLTFPEAKVTVVDLRGGKRQRVTIGALTAGTPVRIAQKMRGGVLQQVKVKIGR